MRESAFQSENVSSKMPVLTYEGVINPGLPSGHGTNKVSNQIILPSHFIHCVNKAGKGIIYSLLIRRTGIIEWKDEGPILLIGCL